MKKLLVLLIMLSLLLAACGKNYIDEDEPRSRRGGSATTAEEEAADTATPPLTDDSAQNQEPQKENIRAADETALREFVRIISTSALSVLPVFEDINEVPLPALLVHYFWESSGWAGGLFGQTADVEYTWEQAEALGAYGEAAGVFPHVLDTFFKENLNPNFSIDSYDYKKDINEFIGSKWDAVNNAIVFTVGISGGFGRNTNGITEMYKSGDEYLVYTAQLKYNYYFPVIEAEYFVYTFTKNANGVFNIMSIKQETAGYEPEWLRLSRMFHDSVDEGDDFGQIAFADINGDGIKDVVIFSNYGWWEKEQGYDDFLKVVDMQSYTVTEKDIDTFNIAGLNFHEVDRHFYGTTPWQHVTELFRDYY
jgi:hypothetical protein